MISLESSKKELISAPFDSVSSTHSSTRPDLVYTLDDNRYQAGVIAISAQHVARNCAVKTLAIRATMLQRK